MAATEHVFTPDTSGPLIREESIFGHYSVDNEIAFMRKIRHLPYEERQLYIKENIRGFLAEYVGAVPYKMISYVLTENGLEYAGIPVMATYWDTAKRGGFGSREWHETVGMDRVDQALRGSNSDVDMATVFSPPKGADYGFVFHFVTDDTLSTTRGKLVHEYILRYDEKVGSTEQTTRIAMNLVYNPLISTIIEGTNGFLENPFVGSQRLHANAFGHLLQMVGINPYAIEESQRFENMLAEDRQIRSWTEYYSQQLIEMATRDDAEPTAIPTLKLILGAIYNRARELKESMRQPFQEIVFEQASSLTDTVPYADLLQHYALARPLTVVGGGNCGITKESPFEPSYLSSADIYQSLTNSITVEQLMHKSGDYKNDPNLCRSCGKENEPHFHCPGKKDGGSPCNHPIVVGKGITTCPKCGAGKTC